MSILALPFARPPALFLIEPIVRRALEEDLGRAGDLTTDLLIPYELEGRANIVSRATGTLCGLICAACAFRLLDGSVQIDAHARDGAPLSAGQPIAAIEGRIRALLGAERVALNFVGHLSGIATATRELVDAVADTRARIVCTRKTTPGLRVLEKYAVRCGGGFNHRFGLDDAVLIKDNHIAAAGGLRPAIERVRQGLGHMVMVEVEVDTLDQLKEALALGVSTILLDNMTLDDMKTAAEFARGRALLEASGGITIQTIRAVAETGVDFISAGGITHSARNVDVGLDF
ncbi:MAG TPA: carboxylating nicotinate-nucleotide diphosphorylase [Rhizomicrobium sp.]|jgi:nicotinate-nucleotide pyrophosphorylase (carboxylating)|nr:carboxylating nicotinate-nucleotide diphosphorylase [Rhizomicrobium sp.]